MPADRFRLRRRLQSIRLAERQGKPQERNLVELARQIDQSIEVRRSREAGVPPITFSADLPIAARRAEIAAAIERNQVVVVCGETGSGKSTQLPKICLELGRGIEGVIGHTQPRRIAARSVAARIAEELGTPLGDKVGFKVRFTDATDPRTYIKLMTDGILLAESQHDRFLNQYDTIILDEAHERSLNIDFLLGYLKGLLPKRPDLKLIITSATIDAERFSRALRHVRRSGAGHRSLGPNVSGRDSLSPLGVRRIVHGCRCVRRSRPRSGRRAAPNSTGSRACSRPSTSSPRSTRGDMLIFLPTEQDIHTTAKALRGRAIAGSEAEILPLYARLSTADQDRIFQPHIRAADRASPRTWPSRADRAGHSLRDRPGHGPHQPLLAASKVQRLPIEPVSQASADQRTGRCGRVGPGHLHPAL